MVVRHQLANGFEVVSVDSVHKGVSDSDRRPWHIGILRRNGLCRGASAAILILVFSLIIVAAKNENEAFAFPEHTRSLVDQIEAITTVAA